MIKVAFLVLIAVLLVQAYASDDMIDRDDATHFLNTEQGLEMAVRGLKYNGREQRNEAKEKYEEKCGRSFVSRKFKRKRWCPKLTLWNEWNAATAKDKKKSSFFG